MPIPANCHGAFLFGSVTKQDTSPGDLDVGLLFSSRTECCKEAEEYSIALTESLKTRSVLLDPHLFYIQGRLVGGHPVMLSGLFDILDEDCPTYETGPGRGRQIRSALRRFRRHPKAGFYLVEDPSYNRILGGWDGWKLLNKDGSPIAIPIEARAILKGPRWSWEVIPYTPSMGY